MVKFSYQHDGLPPVDHKIRIRATIHLTEEMVVSGAEFNEEGFKKFIEEKLTARLKERIASET